MEIPKEDKIDKLYSILKGGVGAIPFVGSIVSEIFGLIISQPYNKRKEKWMKDVVNQLIELEEKIDSFKIESLKENEEFVSFLIETSQIAVKTHQEEKIKILLNSISNFYSSDISFDKKYSFIKTIEEVTPTHLKILKYIFENENYIIENIKGFKSLYKHFTELSSLSIDKYFFRKCVRDLENISLIRISGDFSDYIGGGGFATDESAPSIKILDYGYEFINYLFSN